MSKKRKTKAENNEDIRKKREDFLKPFEEDAKQKHIEDPENNKHPDEAMDTFKSMLNDCIFQGGKVL